MTIQVRLDERAHRTNIGDMLADSLIASLMPTARTQTQPPRPRRRPAPCPLPPAEGPTVTEKPAARRAAGWWKDTVQRSSRGTMTAALEVAYDWLRQGVDAVQKAYFDESKPHHERVQIRYDAKSDMKTVGRLAVAHTQVRVCEGARWGGSCKTTDRMLRAAAAEELRQRRGQVYSDDTASFEIQYVDTVKGQVITLTRNTLAAATGKSDAEQDLKWPDAPDALDFAEKERDARRLYNRILGHFHPDRWLPQPVREATPPKRCRLDR